MNKTSRKNRRAGRPGTGSAGAEKRLLDSARLEFAQNGFRRTSLRAVAARANVNVAMVRYHFDSKQGLYEAVLRETLRQAAAPLRRKNLDGHVPIERFVKNFMLKLADNPWIANLILRELAADRTQLHAVFMSEFVAGLIPQLLEIVTQAQRGGELADDTDPRLVVQTLLANMLLPFALIPTAAPVLGLNLHGKDLKRLIRHTQDQFLRGTAPRG